MDFKVSPLSAEIENAFANPHINPASYKLLFKHRAYDLQARMTSKLHSELSIQSYKDGRYGEPSLTFSQKQYQLELMV